MVSRLRIAGLGIGRVDSATGLWYRAVCSAQLARERTERERGKGGGGGVGRCHAVLLINDTQFLYHLRVTIMFGSVGLATAVICPQSPPSPSPPLTCCCLSFVRTFVALHRSCILKLCPQNGSCFCFCFCLGCTVGLRRAGTVCARSADCGIIYYARNLIHVTYLLLNAPSKATQESETETEKETERESETETESESVSELELKSEHLVGVCSRLGKLVNLLMTHARGKQQEREMEKERGREGESSDCGGALMWVQFQYKHKHKG